MPDCIVFNVEEILPSAWRRFLAEGPVRAFNPGLLRDGTGWLLAFRVVATDGVRRIALCRLDSQLRPLAGSGVPLTDHVRVRTDRGYAAQALVWFADPRLYRFHGRIFIYWNSGWHEPQNAQFLQELDARTLLPIGGPRELVLADGPRQPLEKNWVLFGDGPLFAVYSPSPQRVLSFSIEGDGDIVFSDLGATSWDATKLRGGAPPQPHDGHYWSFCHTIEPGSDGYRYAAAIYRFAGGAPFAPTAAPDGPLALGNPYGGRRVHEKLNPAVGEVLYPCGAARDGNRWLVSHGINDEHCAISALSDAEIAGALRPIAAAR